MDDNPGRLGGLGVTARLTLMLALLFTLLHTASAHAQYDGNLKGTPYEYKDPLPFLGKRIAKRGVRFPLPWGIGLNYMFMQQPIDISSISLGVNDSPLVNMSGVIKFKSVESKLHALNVRLDCWVFPFLNVYAIGSYSPNADTAVKLSEPFPLEAGTQQSILGSGFGFTAAFGAFGAWTTLDVNWSWNHAELLSNTVLSTLLTPRVGMKAASWNHVALNVWAGAMGQFISAETTGSINLGDALSGSGGGYKDQVNTWFNGLSRADQQVVQSVVSKINDSDLKQTTIHYELDKKVAARWNMLLGAQLELNTRWALRAEVGFIRRESVMVGLNYRFATPGFH